MHMYIFTKWKVHLVIAKEIMALITLLLLVSACKLCWNNKPHPVPCGPVCFEGSIYAFLILTVF